MTKEIPLTRGMVALVDDEDYERVSQFKWTLWGGTGNTIYAGRKGRKNEARRTVLLHRFILDAPAGVEVDHINRNGLDCRRSNLRLATRAQNASNCAQHRAAKSPYKGVYRNGSGFIAQVSASGKVKHLGYYRHADAAARIYDAVVTRLRGEFAVTNFPDIDPHADTIAAVLIEEKGLAA